MIIIDDTLKSKDLFIPNLLILINTDTRKFSSFNTDFYLFPNTNHFGSFKKSKPDKLENHEKRD